MAVALQGVERLSTAHLPQAHRLIITAAGNSLLIEAEDDGLYSIGVACGRS